MVPRHPPPPSLNRTHKAPSIFSRNKLPQAIQEILTPDDIPGNALNFLNEKKPLICLYHNGI